MVGQAAMKKFLNNVDDLLHESLRGFGKAHRAIVATHEDPAFVIRATPRRDKVALISGGGSGHEPLHAGFVGMGMLDAACPGHVFTSPTPDQMVAAANAVDSAAGVLWIVKNYSGDVMNFEIAAELIDGSQSLLVNDDVAVEDSAFTAGRRGVAGTLILEKIVGAAAEEGADLEACVALGRRVIAATRSFGVALTSCTVPAAGTPTFDITDTEMEIGVGIHGESGRHRQVLGSADAIAEQMMTTVLADLAPATGSELLFMVNGFGGTPLMELYLMYEAGSKLLTDGRFTVGRSIVGNYVTSLEMAGCSFTVTTLDSELVRLWDAPVHTASLRWGC